MIKWILIKLINIQKYVLKTHLKLIRTKLLIKDLPMNIRSELLNQEDDMLVKLDELDTMIYKLNKDNKNENK